MRMGSDLNEVTITTGELNKEGEQVGAGDAEESV